MTRDAERSAPHSDHVRRAQRSVSSIVSRRIHSGARRWMTRGAQRSAPHSDHVRRAHYPGVRRAERSISSDAKRDPFPRAHIDEAPCGTELAAFIFKPRAAERSLYRLATDSFRRETLNDEGRGAKRAAFRSTSGARSGAFPLSPRVRFIRTRGA